MFEELQSWPFMTRPGRLHITEPNTPDPDMSATGGRFTSGWPAAWAYIGLTSPAACAAPFDQVGPWLIELYEVAFQDPAPPAYTAPQVDLGWEALDKTDRVMAKRVRVDTNQPSGPYGPWQLTVHFDDDAEPPEIRPAY